MDPLEEISTALTGGARVIVISETDVDLRPTSPGNRLFLLRIAEGSLASGGRGGGFGERRVVRVSAYAKSGPGWTRLFDTESTDVERFEVPHYVSRIPLTLPDGTESMGYGVVEADLVRQMSELAKIPSSP